MAGNANINNNNKLEHITLLQPQIMSRLQHIVGFLIAITSITSCRVLVAAAAAEGSNNILVVGSMNLDTILRVDRLPTEGENICTVPHCDVVEVPGGKGCNQVLLICMPHYDYDIDTK